MVSQLTWMTDASKQRAYEKIRLMDKSIGYPRFIDDDARFDAHFASLNFDNTDNNFLLMQNAVGTFDQQKGFEKLLFTRDDYREEWFMPATLVCE